MDKISFIGPIKPIVAQSVLNAPGVAVKPASNTNASGRPSNTRTRRVPDFLEIVITREEVEANNVKPVLSVLESLLDDANAVKKLRGKVDMAISGYDDDDRELYEIPDVRRYIRSLDDAFKYWFYFISTEGQFLGALVACLCSVERATGEPLSLNSEKMHDFAISHFGAVNVIFHDYGFPEKENDELTDRIVAYF